MDRRSAIIMALGQPSDPLPHDETVREIAQKVEALLPGWTLRGATLESRGSVAAATEELHQPLVYPLFMTNGFFLAEVLPERLARIAPCLKVLPPLGADPAFPRLVVSAAQEAARAHGFAPEDTSLLLAAHGSETYPASRLSTEELATKVIALSNFRQVVTGFIEESPFIFESARSLGQAICLPVFAVSASHVTIDIPEALAKAEFGGVLLDPIGIHPAVPALIASALRAHAMNEAA